MNLINKILIGICCLLFFNACGNMQKNKTLNTDSNTVDTLKIGYSDTVLLGQQQFPATIDFNKLKDILEDKILLSFESGDYHYIFFNKKKKIDVLSSRYWNRLMRVCKLNSV